MRRPLIVRPLGIANRERRRAVSSEVEERRMVCPIPSLRGLPSNENVSSTTNNMVSSKVWNLLNATREFVVNNGKKQVDVTLSPKAQHEVLHGSTNAEGWGKSIQFVSDDIIESVIQACRDRRRQGEGVRAHFIPPNIAPEHVDRHENSGFEIKQEGEILVVRAVESLRASVESIGEHGMFFIPDLPSE